MSKVAAPAAPPADTVVCAFYDPSKSLVVEHAVKIDTGLRARMVAIRHAAQDFAKDHGFPMFASPACVEGSERWLVFRMESRMAMYLRDWPNYGAAAMWMQLNG